MEKIHKSVFWRNIMKKKKKKMKKIHKSVFWRNIMNVERGKYMKISTEGKIFKNIYLKL